MLSSVDNVTIGTCNLASVILNFEEFPALDQVQSSIQFNSRQILQLINGISNDLQKLLKYFYFNIFFLSFKLVTPAASSVSPTRAGLYLND